MGGNVMVVMVLMNGMIVNGEPLVIQNI